MFEKKHEPLAPRSIFLIRLIVSTLVGIVILAITVIVGVIVLMDLENLSYADAFIDAAMIVSSVGVNTPIMSYKAKIFCGYYSLITNFIYISVVGIIFAPLAHRFFHKFHLDS